VGLGAAEGSGLEADGPSSSIETLPPPVSRPVEWRRLWEQLTILREADPATVLDAAYSTADALGGMSEERLVRHFVETPEGRALLIDRSSLTETLADHEALAAMPDGSLGRAYLDFSRRHDLDPHALIAAEHAMSRDYARLDPLRQWVSDRLTVMHDLWHVVVGYDATHAGESALMCFSLPQRLNDRALPIFIVMSVTTGRISARNAWQAFRRGMHAEFLPTASFEDLLPRPIGEARAELGVSPLQIAHPGRNTEAMLWSAPG
jgi:ubiquinone biosynthesis protein COQ4